MIALSFLYLVKQIKESIFVKYFDNITDRVKTRIILKILHKVSTLPSLQS